MRSTRGVWIVFVILGAALWLTSVGVLSHPLYRLALALSFFTWAGYVMWVPKRN